MLPRKGIIKSGNAGNSNKASKPPDQPAASPAEKPLFPPGSGKLPLNLNERRQKNGWDKANIDTHKHKDGWYLKAEKKREEISKGARPQTAAEFAQAPEVKMATTLRDMVEDAVKKASSLYPERGGGALSVLSEEDAPKTIQQLGQLGFKPVQARNAMKFLSQPSPLTSNLLGSLSTLEASIEYLILHVPECDLPERFLPSKNSSNPFITAAHSGSEDLKKRWIEDRAIKEAGWPAHVVRQCTSDPRLLENWELLITSLGKKLIGEDIDSLFSPQASNVIQPVITFGPDEIEALGADYLDPSHLVMPLFSAPITLHILVSANGSYPLTGFPPMYITSTSVPAYVRLYLLSELLIAMVSDGFIEPEEGFCMAAMRLLEEKWAIVEDSGPPDMSTVLRHLIPQSLDDSGPVGSAPALAGVKGRRKGGGFRGDERSDEHIKQEFEVLRSGNAYADMFKARKRLPAFGAQDEFLKKLESSRVVVVVGETGCGKTTQLPQFILDSLIISCQGAKASILVTQPRRLSAISVAARVSAERLEDGSVGYAIRGESKQNKHTKLLFCTTGVVLRRLASGDSLQGVTHVVVDEVHERSTDGDFLLLELKDLLTKHPTLKVVLMSATINEETFVQYFNGAPLLRIPGFTYPVADKYLEDVIPLIKYRPSAARRGRNTGDSQPNQEEYAAQGLDNQTIQAIQAISKADRIDYQLVAAVVGHIMEVAEKKGGILIFLPGVGEIRQCIEALRGSTAAGQDIFPLHANLSNEEQRVAFKHTLKWKIIAATNVAETSITIDDVIYVIDCGKVKETQYDPEKGLSKLVEVWVTRAAGRQRRGRAGRTQPGVCYKMYTRKQEERMARFPVPEILRVPLESISLTVKVMREHEDVKLFLSRAISPPKLVAMESAWSILEELGAVDLDGRLTALGRHMSTLPVDLRLAKMLILGTIFQCLGPILTIAAGLSSKPLFLSPLDKREEASLAKGKFSTGNSDLLTDLKAYDECARIRSEGGSHGAVRTFCEENFISSTTLRDMTSLRLDFINSLSDLGFIPFKSPPSSPTLNTNSNNGNLVKAVVLGGLWSRVARVHLPKSAIKFDRVRGGTVQRENTAKEYKLYDLREGRVFLHPSSVLFGETMWKSPFLTYFSKHMTSKVFLRDATEVPVYAMLLFGGPVTVNHVAGGLTIGSSDCLIKLKAWPRIGILVNQLRRLLDAQLQQCIEDGAVLNAGENDLVVKSMLALLTNDGLSSSH
ncbi:P-loop containing nucleoside triphosphate hydrolase protein [Athelia psychrophila]|uniref:P-loop containing nucleoside triphosphate hydrolase protein n=1 Tax=Athelia psychrophila TaxID=1759441 RepID=A0A166NU25_9AGAM|nr:P-loop containing nucleoside triphosphate hydrolase protein [Fibularhizoctonia sp. CBS 109695]